jgi:hypothetical protein
MMQRLRGALRRERSAAPPERQYRPNELRLDLVRAERLRREARRAEPISNQPARSLEELQGPEPGPQESPSPSPATRPHPVATHVAALKTRSGLRQAWLLTEILGPPLALRHSPTGGNDL